MAGLVGERADEPRFPDSGRPGDEDVELLAQVLAGGERLHEAPVEAAAMTIVDVLNAGGLSESCGSEAVLQAPFGAFGGLLWEPEEERVRNVVVKLAREHCAYELYPRFGEPVEARFAPLDVLSGEERSGFDEYADGQLTGWSEIGSRSFHRACGKPPDRFEQWGDWILVQAGRYRYSVAETDGIVVRMVLSEYLASEVIWER